MDFTSPQPVSRCFDFSLGPGLGAGPLSLRGGVRSIFDGGEGRSALGGGFGVDGSTFGLGPIAGAEGGPSTLGCLIGRSNLGWGVGVERSVLGNGRSTFGASTSTLAEGLDPGAGRSVLTPPGRGSSGFV